LSKGSVGEKTTRHHLDATQLWSQSSSLSSSLPTPIDGSGWPSKFPAKEHCSKCGLCETTFVSKVSDACAFLNDGMSKIDNYEKIVHGRQRKVDEMVWSDTKDTNGMADEGRFGVLHEPMRLARGVGIPNAQWTGCVTGIALSMLESGKVDAVVCIANSGEGWSTPEPILAKTADDVLRGRGVKPALAPSLKVLDQIKQDASIRKLLFCGVGCAVQAFRSIEEDLNLDEVYVLGTNCADNSPTPQAARDFIREGVKIDDTQETIQGYEFMQDFKVHVKTNDSYIKKPYFVLPGTIAEPSIAKSCLACFDYTNALADVVVGYMGAPLESNQRMDAAYQTLTVRNERGSQMVQTAIDSSRLELGEIAQGEGKHEMTASATVASDSIVLAMSGGNVKEEGLPMVVGEIMAFVMRSIGPTGVNFARYSIDYHIIRNYLHILDEWGEERANIAMPAYSRDIVEKYLKTDKTIASLRDAILSNRQ